MFPSYERYREYFYPLLLRETVAAIKSAQEESDGLSVRAQLVTSDASDTFFFFKFHCLENSRLAGVSIENGDIIEVKYNDESFFGLSSSSDPEDVSFKCHPGSAAARKLKSVRSEDILKTTVRISKLMSMVTANREFVALDKLKDFTLLTFFLSPPRDTLMPQPLNMDLLSSDFLKHLASKFNRSQLDALEASCGSPSDIFTMIQGPPGTGKTHLTCGILNALHIALFHAPKVVQRSADEGTETRRHQILVCAPSNAAVDEIVARIVRDKFKDNVMADFQPDLLRIGSAATMNPVVLEVEDV